MHMKMTCVLRHVSTPQMSAQHGCVDDFCRKLFAKHLINPFSLGANLLLSVVTWLRHSVPLECID